MIVVVRLNPKSPDPYIILAVRESFVFMMSFPFCFKKSIIDCNNKKINAYFEATFEAYPLLK